MKYIKVLGIDLAKNVFQLHGVDAKGKCVLRKRLSRSKLIEFIAHLPPTIIGIEACGGAHHWARCFIQHGHEVRMMSPQFVKPYVKSNKSDRNDAEAIAEACVRPTMRFVAAKTIGQQDILALHRVRQLAIKHRTALSNQIRGLLNEYGVIIPVGMNKIKKLPIILDLHHDQLSQSMLELMRDLYRQFQLCDEQVNQYDARLDQIGNEEGIYKEIQKIPGIGTKIATALVATIGDPKKFKNGREVSGWLGLVPKQYSSGEKTVLGRISKRGDKYMRTLLIQGARSAVKQASKKTDRLSQWIANKKECRGFNKAAVALANKNARMVWAIMTTGECYRMPRRLNLAE